MSDERDPIIEAAFAEARQDLTDRRYTQQLMDMIARRRRRVFVGRVVIVMLIVVFELLLSAPIQSSVELSCHIHHFMVKFAD